MVSNLIGNAIKYAPNGGSIRITVIKETREQVVSISDTGPGIPKEQLPKIFDRFWQASENKNLGSGLGLTIAKGIVEAHGGRIWAVSKPGETNFYFSIPNSLQI